MQKVLKITKFLEFPTLQDMWGSLSELLDSTSFQFSTNLLDKLRKWMQEKNNSWSEHKSHFFGIELQIYRGKSELNHESEPKIDGLESQNIRALPNPCQTRYFSSFFSLRNTFQKVKWWFILYRWWSIINSTIEKEMNDFQGRSSQDNDHLMITITKIKILLDGTCRTIMQNSSTSKWYKSFTNGTLKFQKTKNQRLVKKTINDENMESNPRDW